MTTTQIEQQRTHFEQMARFQGFRDFGRRGDMYNVSDLNLLWQGYKMAL